MKNFSKLFITLFILFSFTLAGECFVTEDIREYTLHPDYSYEYNGRDKFETFNRKMFNFNLKMNKYALKPVHKLWASIMPQYGMDRIKCACNNIEFPIRVTSCLIQRDFKNSGKEFLRFLTNSTIGLGGLYDPADKLFNMTPVKEDMDQALASCHIKSGPYLVLPGISSTTPRGIFGKILDAGLNPSCYIGTPVIAMVKAGLLLNKTTDIQSAAKLVEDSFADPYEIARKFYGADRYIKNSNLDRAEVIEQQNKELEEELELVQENSDNEITATAQNSEDLAGIKKGEDGALSISDIANAGNNVENVILKSYDKSNSKLMADLVIFDYNPQTPMIDAMRTALFDFPEIYKSIWNELSIWNRCFNNQIKCASVNIYPNRAPYKFRYILQKDKNAPLAIIFPSIGEGSMSHHSTIFAKIFYDEGYSVLIQGNHFNWEFAKSMPEDYVPGNPNRDVEQIKLVAQKEIEYLKNKYDRDFSEKTVIGTSFGAVGAMFLANSEYKNNTLNITNYIAISPPVNLVYAIRQIDKNCENCYYNSDKLKEKAALTAAKIMQLYNNKEKYLTSLETLPFSNEEAKVITSFVMHQKLSDLVFTLENAPKNKKSDIYTTLNNLTYTKYAQEYLLPASGFNSLEDLGRDTSLLSLQDYLKNANNYKIYQSVDDYFVSTSQLKKLKQLTLDKTILISNGSHLGFLYRKEFLDELKKVISIQDNIKQAMKN